MVFLLQTTVPDGVLYGIIALSILLAVVTMALMMARMQSTPAGEEVRRPPFDPVLLGSAVAVILMAGIAYLTL
jgi:hypothetical protein